jgi:hypothetical protein
MQQLIFMFRYFIGAALVDRILQPHPCCCTWTLGCCWLSWEQLIRSRDGTSSALRCGHTRHSGIYRRLSYGVQTSSGGSGYRQRPRLQCKTGIYRRPRLGIKSENPRVKANIARRLGSKRGELRGRAIGMGENAMDATVSVSGDFTNQR